MTFWRPLHVIGFALLTLASAAPPAALAAETPAADGRQGIRPVGTDGKVLNLDFEDGTLGDWTAAGDAFEKQPIKGDTVSPRRDDQRSNHQGEYWVGGYEMFGDKPTGTLSSKPFKATHRWASFLIAGGPWAETRVELVRADNNRTYFQFSGYENETLRPVIVDFGKQVGQTFFIRVVDEHTGHWGHVNFDNFLFYDEKPKLENVLDPKIVTPPPQADAVKFAGVKPEDAAAAMTLPEGFKATVFAAEPDVVQPIAFTIDERGRLWVAQGLTYPQRQPEGQGKDSIVIFEDTDGDGKHDKRTVFAEKLNLVSGIEVGFGGVYVGAAPYLLFIPDKNGDDKPDGEPQILLDGWAYQDTHETLNTFLWGPDGWLYGCHGIFTYSNVGKPGATKDQRTPINAGYWRYHPVRHEFEVFAEGTSNPWGMDFDERGQLFAEACVIPHLWHVIQGARYQRQAGNHFNPHTFDDIKQAADHLHYAGNQGPHAGNGRSDLAGGGHAHAGLMIYQGDNWPEEYRGKIFIGNIHGQRINMDIPEPRGSGYVGRHGADFLNFNDRWSQVINFRTGPDGGVYFIDWYDEQQCHNGDVNAHDRKNGRIYKVWYGDVRRAAVAAGLSKLSDVGLLELQTQENDWLARQARRILQERAADGLDLSASLGVLQMIDRAPSQKVALRALWILHATGALTEEVAVSLLKSPKAAEHPYLVGWAIQLLCEGRNPPSAALKEFERLAKQLNSPTVRVYLASALQRIPLERRWNVLAPLLAHSEDAGDHNLPLMYWYALEPMAAVDPGRMLALALETSIPNILSFTVRRIGAIEGDGAIAALSASVGRIDDDARRVEILRGIQAALKGRPTVPMPKGWEAVQVKLSGSENAEVRSLAQALSVTFGSTDAVKKMKSLLADAAAPAEARRDAADALIGARDASIIPILQRLLDDEAVRGSALRGLAAFEDPKTADLILSRYKNFSTADRRDALNTLASREAYADKLFAAVDCGTVPASDVTADLVRQLRNLQNPQIDERIAKAWQVQRKSPEEKLQLMAAIKAMINTSPSGSADPSRGRAVFAKTCMQCHVLFDVGGAVGPNITGSNRADLDYLLLHVVDPNAVIPHDYRTTIAKLKDGRVITGILSKQDGRAVTVLTANETLILPREQIERLKDQEISMMPEGLLEGLNDADQRDLIAYLRSPAQVPLAADAPPAADARPEGAAATEADAKAFFNGKDLTGWEGRADVWKVENGEIVGKSEKGLANNEFLKNKLRLADFRLVFKMKLVPDTENSGVQFRSAPVADSPEMKGYQADAGKGWWGKLYHESGRGLLWDKDPPEGTVKPGEWNTYEILAVGHKIRTAVNGKPCVDLEDPQGELDGQIAVQVHSGGPIEVRFRDFELEVNPKFELKTAK